MFLKILSVGIFCVHLISILLIPLNIDYSLAMFKIGQRHLVDSFELNLPEFASIALLKDKTGTAYLQIN